jgi:hypothetical protein
MDIVFTTHRIAHHGAMEKAHTQALVTRIDREIWDEIQDLGTVRACSGFACLHVRATRFGEWLDKRTDANWHGYIHFG